MATLGFNIKKAAFINIDGGSGPFWVQYNPTQFQYKKGLSWKDHEVQGQEAKSLEYQTSKPAQLSMELLFDTTNESGTADVRTKYVNGLLTLTNPIIDAQDGQSAEIQKKRPPRVLFVWGTFKMTGAIENVDVTYLMFSESGIPIRAKVTVTLKEWLPELHAAGSGGRGMGNDKVKLVTMGPGETVTAVALRMGVSTSQLCADNNIDDPLNVPAGTSLVVRS
jgi:LysM repeat protein